MTNESPGAHPFGFTTYPTNVVKQLQEQIQQLTEKIALIEAQNASYKQRIEQLKKAGAV